MWSTCLTIEQFDALLQLVAFEIVLRKIFSGQLKPGFVGHGGDAPSMTHKKVQKLAPRERTCDGIKVFGNILVARSAAFAA